MELNVNKIIRDAYLEVEKNIKKQITEDIINIMKKVGKRNEERLFTYITRYVFGHADYPRIIEGISTSDYFDSWEPLSETTIRKKGGKVNAWIDTGELKRYLRSIKPSNIYYGEPDVVEYDNGELDYYSMYSNDRKSFDKKQEIKVAMNEDLRPMLYPMEDFITEEITYREINKQIQKYLEKNYGR